MTRVGSTDEQKRFRAMIKGRVQGVFFRVTTQERAQELGLVGYARNLPDGAVEVEAEGDEKKLEQLIGFLQTGPQMAQVEDVEVVWRESLDKENDFRVL